MRTYTFYLIKSVEGYWNEGHWGWYPRVIATRFTAKERENFTLPIAEDTQWIKVIETEEN